MKINYPKNFSDSRNKTIINYCLNKKVLHIWSCDSPFTKEKLKWKYWPLLYKEIDSVCKEQLWIDLDKKSIEILNKEKIFNKSKSIFFDMNKLENLDYSPDIIIFWEVIEHLMNIEIAISNIKKIMKKDTILIISTPNAFYFWSFINSVFWVEYLHDDHKILFSFWYLKNILKYNWIKIEKWFFTTLDIDKKLKNFNFLWKIMKYFKIFRYNSDTILLICKKWN